MNSDFVLLTAARNEEEYIENTIKSVLCQSVIPVKWVIVSDGSFDNTDGIVKRYVGECSFIEFLRVDDDNRSKGFASKVNAIRKGFDRLSGLKYSFLGNLDADITIPRDYYECMLQKFLEDPGLGIGGGFLFEKYHGLFQCRPHNRVEYVSGAIQFFRRECYESIGGYRPLSEGGEDTVAVISAMMKGWKVRSFQDLIVYHHKRGDIKRGVLKESFREGSMSFALGGHPVFEIMKSLRRIGERPFLISAFVRLTGFFSHYCFRKERAVDREFIQFFRKQQFKRIKSSQPWKGSFE